MITHITEEECFSLRTASCRKAEAKRNALAHLSKYCPGLTRIILSRTWKRTLKEANRESRRPKEKIVFQDCFLSEALHFSQA
jgi:hypothetical protein